MKTALVTGSSGFLGREFVKALTRQSYEVHPMDLMIGQDLLKRVHDLSHQYDLVVHAAAKAPYRKAIDQRPDTSLYNALLDATVFQWAVETRQPHLLYISSSAVYSDDLAERTHMSPFKEKFAFDDEPFDAYGQVKRQGERLADQARACGVAVTVVRPFSGYGPHQTNDFPFGAFADRAHRQDIPFKIWGDSNQVRDFIHVEDIVAGALTVVEDGTAEPVNICTGIGTSMFDLATMFIREKKYTTQIVVDTKAPMGVFYRVGDPKRFHNFYTPKITLADGVRQALAVRNTW